MKRILSVVCSALAVTAVLGFAQISSAAAARPASASRPAASAPAIQILHRNADGTFTGRVVARSGLYIREWFPDSPPQHFLKAPCDPFQCTLAYGTLVNIDCQIANDRVDGAYGWTNVWDDLSDYYGEAWLGVSSDGWLNTGTNGLVHPCPGY